MKLAAKDPCDEDIVSYAWIDPGGKLYKVTGHEYWAGQYLKKKDPNWQQQLQEWGAGVEGSGTAGNYLLYEGWIRVSNFFAFEMWRGKVSAAAKKAAVVETAACLVRRRFNAEKKRVYIDEILDFSGRGLSGKFLRLSAADFMEKWGGRSFTDKVYWSKVSSAQRVAARYLRKVWGMQCRRIVTR